MSYARFGSPLVEMTLSEYEAWYLRRNAAVDSLGEFTGRANEHLPADLQGSDVYVYLDCCGYLCCCGCSLGDEWNFYTTADMLAHLAKHREAGHNVPQRCIDGLIADREENDQWIGAEA